MLILGGRKIFMWGLKVKGFFSVKDYGLIMIREITI